MNQHGSGHFRIELLEKYPCEDKEELLKEEGKYIREMNPELNKNIAGRTKKEYYADNKQQVLDKYEHYYQDNKDKIDTYRKDYWQEHKDRRKEICKKSNEKHKEEIKERNDKNKDEHRKRCQKHYQQHKEEAHKKMQVYRDNGREKLKHHATERVKCECGMEVSRSNISSHRKSTMHNQAIEK